ncbi:hypothetical protein HYH02_001018 [Chlamydomonas schloesseri]|uniref:N-acetyltransferase domain-containing protein n=1 Tax=Chlamydomonas schloesseri TaxID=2026947 RepID=A0A835WU10_9CHLO|nr:hypothetical protein HYH02_001018 [Chlamydomonas schloesseri]|eukprot:KAG2453972.1 hypothetical protein HYH02_001018 [Chlamydomonas schloesseri]
MASQKGLPKGATVRVRLYRPEDHDVVARIFSAGMMGLVPIGVEEIARGDKRLQAVAVAVPAVALALARRCSMLTKLGVGLLSTAAVPAVIYVLVRSLFAKYVKKSLEDDLANIERFYSTHGAGAGSAFWVAELVEPVGEPGSAASGAAAGAASLPAYKRTFSTSLLSTASPEPAGISEAVAVAPVPAPVAVASSSPAQTTHSPAQTTQANPAPPQPDAPPQAEQASVRQAPSSAAPVAASPPVSGHSKPAAPAASTSAAVGAAQEPAAGPGAEPETAASAAGAETEDPDAEARRVVAGLVAAAVRRLEAASTAAAAAPSSSAPPVSPGPKANGSSSAAASGLTSPRGGTSAVGKLPAAPVPPAPPVQVASPAAVTPKPTQGVVAAGASQSTAAAKPATPVAALATSASIPRTPSSAAFGASTAPAVRTRVVGHVALERKTWQVAELRRMSVAPEFRGAGVGRALLAALTAHARDVGFRELVLYTSSLQLPAHRLYEQAGWTLTERVPESGIEMFTYTYDLTKKR